MNNALNVATKYSPFYLNAGGHPLVTSALMHGGVVSSGVEAMQTMVDRMKTTLEEAQANLSIVQHKAQTYANKSQRDEKYKVGDEVVLTTRHLPVSQHLPVKLRRHWVRTLQNCQRDFSSGLWIGPSPSLAGLSCLPCQ